MIIAMDDSKMLRWIPVNSYNILIIMHARVFNSNNILLSLVVP